jgi:hypothetical protein
MITNQQVAQYPDLLDFAYQVINSLKGTQPDDARWVDCQRLSTKIWLHAVTINHLRGGSNVTLRDFKDGAHIKDFASVMVITRSMLETYLTLFEVFFESKDVDLLEYRHAVYQIDGFAIRENQIKRKPNAYFDISELPKIEHQIREIEDMRDRVKKTQHYQTLDKNQRDSSLKGSLCPKRGIEVVAESAGFKSSFFQKAYVILCSYTHGDALSVAQIHDAKTDEERDAYMRLSMATAMMVLSRLILNYAEKFPQAKVIFDSNPNRSKLVKIIKGVS